MATRNPLPARTFSALAALLHAAKLYEIAGPNPGLVQPGNIDLLHRPVVHNQDGSISTVKSVSFGEPGGREVLVPEVVGEPPRVVGPRQALNAYQQTGQQLGVFSNVGAANNYAQRLHQQQARVYGGSPLANALGGN